MRSKNILIIAMTVNIMFTTVFAGLTTIRSEEIQRMTASYPLEPTSYIQNSKLVENFDSEYAIIITDEKNLFSLNPLSFQSSILSPLPTQYEYDLDSRLIETGDGGKIFFNDRNIPPKKIEGFYFHKGILNPYSGELMSFYFKDLVSQFKLFIGTKELKIKPGTVKNYITPLTWINETEILVGEYYPEASFLESIYKINTKNSTIVPVPFLTNLRIKSAIRDKNKLIALTTDGLKVLDYFSNVIVYEDESFIGEVILGKLKREKFSEMKKSLSSEMRAALTVSSTPFLYWPVTDDHTIVCDIGCYSGHKGIDVGVSTAFTTAIRAAADGKVVALESSQPVGKYRVTSPGTGNYVKLEHNINGSIYYTSYLHLNKNIQVTLNQNITAGTIIGYGSNSGFTCGYEEASNGGCQGYPGSYSHLHFQVNGSCGNDGCWLNPATENLWLKNSSGVILDPPVGTCGGSNVVLSNQTISVNFICNASNSITINPETFIIPTYNSEIKFYIM